MIKLVMTTTLMSEIRPVRGLLLLVASDDRQRLDCYERMKEYLLAVLVTSQSIICPEMRLEEDTLDWGESPNTLPHMYAHLDTIFDALLTHKMIHPTEFLQHQSI